MSRNSVASRSFFDTRINCLSASTSTLAELTLRVLPSAPRCTLRQTVVWLRSRSGVTIRSGAKVAMHLSSLSAHTGAEVLCTFARAMNGSGWQGATSGTEERRLLQKDQCQRVQRLGA